MIGFLEGKVAFRDDPFLFINVGGVGYKVFASRDVLSAFPLGSEGMVFTYTHVKEDALDLFGFLNLEDLKLFEQLISVSGIGPRTAINIFSVGTRSEILQAIISGDVGFFTAVPRLGKKNAQRIIVELKSKFGEAGELDLSATDGVAQEEVTAALKSIGFSPSEIRDALKNVKEGSVEEKIKMAIKYLGK